MSDPFQTSRDDGRPDWQVIFDLVSEADPDTTFSYDEITDALKWGLDPDIEIERRRVYRAVTATNKRLLRERRRYLSVVRDYGYRIIRAEEHLPVALTKKSAAVEQLSRGIELLRHVELHEIPEAQRKLHQGQLMIMASLHTAILESERRHQRQEAIIDEIKARQEADLGEIRQRLEALEEAGE